MKRLYQEFPKWTSTYTRPVNRSPTDSIASYQNHGWKECVILRRNNRVPTKSIKLGLYRKYSVQKINTYRTKIFRFLREHDFAGDASIELTRGADGYPNNCIHFHVITDDSRSEHELRELFEEACRHAGLDEKCFGIIYYDLYDGFGYLEYFTKCARRFANKVILFRNEKELGARIQRFYQIGGWFRKGKKKLWNPN